MFSWISIEEPDDFYGIGDIVEDTFFDVDYVADRLKVSLSKSIKGILIEDNYVDKDYRSTYYNFYAKKGLKYPANCSRLHFFGEGVSLTDEFCLKSEKRSVQDEYYGFMVIRPTPNAPIGRTVLSHAAVNGFDGKLITAQYVVHVLGERLRVEGFSYMEQHSDISVCAHAACWSIMRHHSTRYKRYAELLIHDITRMAVPHDPGGLTPSRGLGPEAASRVFSLAGLFPDTYSATDGNRAKLLRMLLAYIESGMPVFAMKEGHAFAVVGHGRPDLALLDDDDETPIYWWGAINSFIVIDDNFMPYRRVGSLETETNYLLSDIEGFIVPLPDKVYMPADALEIFIEDAIRVPTVGLDFSHIKKPVVRYFLTTSATLRKYVKEAASLLTPAFAVTLQMLVLPQFVWLVEVADLTEMKAGRSNLLFIVDATASPTEDWPFFLVHDRNRAYVYDRAMGGEKEIKFERQLNYWVPFELNLPPPRMP